MNSTSDWVDMHRSKFQHAFQQALQDQLPLFSSQLHTAIDYVTKSSGKMLRPLLCFASAQACGISFEKALPYAMAIEAIHIYSLVHDDLPSMDDDDLRRGRPTCHKAFDEATAILVGDALQSMAFGFLAQSNLPDQIKVNTIQALANAAGPKGMVGGQMLDIQASSTGAKTINLQSLDQLHSLKTGALISASIQAGILLQTSPDMQKKDQLTEFGQLIGLAFQIQDDILDITGSTEVLGKPAKSDESSQKMTYPALLGLDESQLRLQLKFTQAIEIIDKIAGDTSYLKHLAEMIVIRSH